MKNEESTKLRDTELSVKIMTELSKLDSIRVFAKQGFDQGLKETSEVGSLLEA